MFFCCIPVYRCQKPESAPLNRPQESFHWWCVRKFVEVTEVWPDCVQLGLLHGWCRSVLPNLLLQWPPSCRNNEERKKLRQTQRFKRKSRHYIKNGIQVKQESLLHKSYLNLEKMRNSFDIFLPTLLLHTRLQWPGPKVSLFFLINYSS